jgi:hypothetical protein
MKKLLVFIMLLVSTYGASAQSGGLTISVNGCGVWVKLYAVENTIPANGLCRLTSNTFYLAPGVYTWCSVWDFQGPFGCGSAGFAPGWASGVGIPLTSTQFQWTDVTYQYECLGCGGGGNLTNNPLVVLPWASTCLTPSPSLCGGGTWTPGTLLPMGNLTLTF